MARAGAYSVEETPINQFFSQITSGGYARSAVAGILEQVPLLNMLPFEFSMFEDEISQLLEKESSRLARRAVHQELGRMGLGGNLSLTAGPSPQNRRLSFQRSDLAGGLKWHAHVSSRRLALSLLYRF